MEEKVIVKTWLLGLRIFDACRIEWQWFNFTPSEDLKEVTVNTHKEDITAHVFVDPEFQRLLAKFTPSLDQKSKYLFQSEGSHISEKHLLRKLQRIARKANIAKNGKVFGWHIARKLFMRVCAENGVVSWNAQLMVGKAVDKSISTYINGVSLKNDATKVSNVLRMEPKLDGNGRVGTLMQAVDLVLKVQRKMILEQLQQEGYGQGLGLMIDYSKLSTKELMEEYLKRD